MKQSERERERGEREEDSESVRKVVWGWGKKRLGEANLFVCFFLNMRKRLCFTNKPYRY